MSKLMVASWIRACDEANFAWFFRPHRNLEVINARTAPVALGQIDGLLLTGGPDISEEFLKQPVPDPSLIEDAEPERDRWERTATEHALTQHLPILAVCKGLQSLNVTLGGTLHLHLPGHNLPEQKLQQLQPLEFTTEPTVRFPVVNSSHHQALDWLGSGLVPEAWSEPGHVVEQARVADYPFALGVQYHPERHPSYYPLFDLFAWHVRKRGAGD